MFYIFVLFIIVITYFLNYLQLIVFSHIFFTKLLLALIMYALFSFSKINKLNTKAIIPYLAIIYFIYNNYWEVFPYKYCILNLCYIFIQINIC